MMNNNRIYKTRINGIDFEAKVDNLQKVTLSVKYQINGLGITDDEYLFRTKEELVSELTKSKDI